MVPCLVFAFKVDHAFLLFQADMGGNDAPTPEEKEKLEQLERERLEALR